MGRGGGESQETCPSKVEISKQLLIKKERGNREGRVKGLVPAGWKSLDAY